MPSPEALALVKAAAAAHKRKLAGVAAHLGYSRPALSRYVNGSYIGEARLEATIFERYQGMRACPHSGEEVPVAECRKRAYAPEPFGGAARLAAWQACQQCALRPPPKVTPVAAPVAAPAVVEEARP